MAYQYRVNARYQQKGVNPFIELPGIVTESGLLLSHLRYLAAYQNKSLSWKKTSVTALILLIKYIEVYQYQFDSPIKLLKAFSTVLGEGTLNYDELTDTSGLYWKPRKPSNVRNLINHISL